jgi:hypothetical protein
MFYLVDTCGKELADCLYKATAEGKSIWSWAFHHLLFFFKGNVIFIYETYRT